MPEALFYPMDPNSSAAKLIEEAFIDEHEARAERIKLGWAYYNGEQRRQLKIQKDGYDDNIVLNQVDGLADRITAFLTGDGIAFDAEGEQSDEDINALWDASRGDILKDAIVLAGCIEGHNAVRLDPQEGDYPRLTRIRMTNFAAFWNPFDTTDVLWYRLQHVAAGMGRRIDYARGRLVNDELDPTFDEWVELVYEARDIANVPGGAPRWQLVSTQPWPYAWAPIVDWQNLPNANGYYGRSDIFPAAIHLNDALNFLLSNAQRIIKHHADPKTVGTGFTVNDLVKSEVGGLFTVAAPEARIYNLEMQSDGALMQWLVQLITSGLWQSGGMVDNSTVKDLVGQLTNFGLRVLFTNAIKRTEKKRALYDEAFDEIGRYGLELAGRAVPEKITTVWPDILPEDQATIDSLMKELEAGIISKETYRKIRGYEHDQEEDRLAQEQTTGDVGTSILGLLANNRGFNRGA